MASANIDTVSFNFINDWPLRRFVFLGLLAVVGIILFTIIRSISSGDWDGNLIGYAILPLVIFIPGAAVLRIFRIHDIGFSKPLLYSLGLGLIILMATGGLLNILHYIGVSNSPFNIVNINLTYASLLIALLALTYRRDRSFECATKQKTIDVGTILTICFGTLLPILVVIGSMIAGYDGDRSIIFYALVAICASPLIMFGRSTGNYGFVVFSLSLSLMLHQGLMTNYLMGNDVFSEYFTAYSSTTQGYWDVFLRFGANTAMSMTTLAPMLTNLTSIQTIEVLKIVYPILFSFTGLAVFKVVKTQLGPRPALAAALLYIGYQVFFGQMMQFTKQQIAEIFLLIFFLSLLDVQLTRGQRRSIVVVSLFGIVVSHYALGYIALGFVAGLVLFNSLWHALPKVNEMRKGEVRDYPKALSSLVRTWYKDQRKNQIISVDLAILFLAIFLLWYSITASGMMLQYGQNVDTIVGVPESGLYLFQMDAIEFVLIDYGNALHNVEKYLVIFSFAICVIGVAFALLRFNLLNKEGLQKDFVILGILATLILIGCFTIPRLSYTLYFARFFHIVYIFLSGFFMLGLYAIINFFIRKSGDGFGPIDVLNKKGLITKLGTAFLVAFLLFNTSAIYYSVNDYSRTFALDPDIGTSAYSDSDVLSYKWIGDYERRGDYPVTVDWHSLPMFYSNGTGVSRIKYQWTENQTDTLLYLSTWNVKTHWVTSVNRNGSSIQSYTPLDDILNQVQNKNESVIYSTGGYAMIMFLPPSEGDTNPPGPPDPKYVGGAIYLLPGALAFGIAAVALTLLMRRIR
jgi:uncharacterized membrane protein